MSTDGVAPAVGATDASPAQQGQNTNSNSVSSQNGTPVNSVAQANVGGDSLTCQWQSCGERCATAESLYDHVCERHVGRKSTNNLNLTCQWGNCRTTTVKRDHITSHIRVHVPLKPHKCDFCGKAFKRPQDLKKHVKTHADDSVLLRSPEPNRANQNGPGGGYQPANSNKLVADLQTLAATASGYYPDHGLSGAGSYYQNGNAQGPYHSATAAAPSGSAYGPVYYAVNQAASLGNDYEVRKRAAFDALNEFFGDAKRRIIDPATYYDVGHRLMSLQGVQLPMLGTVGGGYSSSDSYGGGMAAPAAHLPQQHYTLPLPNLRTKNDLLNIDQFLEQLQSTVYENSNHAAAAGVAQAGAHYTHTGYGFGRSSHSPPSAAHGTSHAGGLGASHASVAPLTTPQTETPALTPASSVMSYTSNAGQSPNSVHSSHNISPSRVSNAGMGGSMYPTLPSVSAMGDMGTSGYSTSGAPASSLATAFDSDHRRRYSGGLLQKEAPAPRRGSYDSRMDEDTPTQSPKAPLSHDGSNSPSSAGSGQGDEERGRQLGRDVRKLNIMSPSMIDPAMRSPAGSGAADEDASTPGRDDADSKQEAWVENIRMIEMLKDFVKGRLERGEYEGEGGRPAAADDDAGEGASSSVKGEPMDEDTKTEEEKDAENLYPVLRAVQGEA